MSTENQDMFGLPDDEAMRQKIIEQGGSDDVNTKWPKTLVEYVEVLEQLYIRRGYSEDHAFKMARDSVMELAEYRGGKVEYLPRGDELKIALIHAEIYRRAKSGNIKALADEFGFTDIHIYRICRQQRALHIRKIQPQLFNEKGN